MTTILEISNLSKRFGGLLAVDSLDLSIRKGEIRGLIGPNGSGKTTVLNLVSGIYVPSSGSILFQGASVLNQRPHVLARAGMKRTFQNSRLFRDLTLLQNVMLGLHAQGRGNLQVFCYHFPACGGGALDCGACDGGSGLCGPGRQGHDISAELALRTAATARDRAGPSLVPRICSCWTSRRQV